MSGGIGNEGNEARWGGEKLWVREGEVREGKGKGSV